MDSFVSRFRTELVSKLRERSASRASEEQTLLKAFKFFDLQKSGRLAKNEFLRALAKIGFVPDFKDGEDIFGYFDVESSGKVEYANFIAAVLNTANNNNVADRSDTLSVTSNTSSRLNLNQQDERVSQQSSQQRPDTLFSRLRTRLSQKSGASGILSFAIMLKNQAAEEQQSSTRVRNPKNLSLRGLYDALCDFRLQEEPDVLAKATANIILKDGSINYDQFIDLLKLPLSRSREDLILATFTRLDSARRGSVATSLVMKRYDERADLEVISGRMSEEEARLAFISSFQSYLDLKDVNNGSREEETITSDEFLEFYSFTHHIYTGDEDFRRSLSVLSASTRPTKPSQSSPEQNTFSPPRPLHLANNSKFNETSHASKRQLVDRHQEADDTLSQRSRVMNEDDTRSNRGRDDQEEEFDTVSMCSQATSTRFMQENKVSQRQIELILARIKNRLASKGTKGFLQFERLLLSTDSDNDGRLSLPEFRKIVRDLRIDVIDSETQIIFHLFDQTDSGLIDLYKLLSSLKGRMNAGRYQLVCEAFEKIDPSDAGVVSYADVQREYYPRAHPDVKTTKSHEDDISNEFFSSLQLHASLYSPTQGNRITRDQFLDFYNNVSAAIVDDKFFEQILVATFRLTQGNRLVNKYAGQRNAFDPLKKGFLQDHHRQLINGGSVASNAPFGTTEEPTHYNRPNSSYSGTASVRSGSPPPISTRSQRPLSAVRQAAINQEKLSIFLPPPASSNSNVGGGLEELKSRLRMRGVRGYIKLYGRLRQVMDNDSGNGGISEQQFTQVLQELRLAVDNSDKIFKMFSKQNMLDLEELFKAVKGKISSDYRQAMIVHAFQQMDNNRSGLVEIDILKESYDARRHPSVRTGKMSEEEVYGDFIDAFELHMETFNPSNLDAGVVHFNEFFEFYHILSETIPQQEDRVFEEIMRNCWRVQV